MPFGKKKSKNVGYRKGYWKKYPCNQQKKETQSKDSPTTTAVDIDTHIIQQIHSYSNNDETLVSADNQSDSEINGLCREPSDILPLSRICEIIAADHDYGDLSGKLL